MNTETARSIITWTLTVFVAGLIGYFGRFLAMMMIDRFCKKEDIQKSEPSKEVELEKARLKAAKKMAKNEYKIQKKLNKE